MAIILNDNLETFSPKPLDERYGPYTSVTEANNSIIYANRYLGLTVGIITGTTTQEGPSDAPRYLTVESGVTEYWYWTGITDLDLVRKEGGDGTSGSSGSSGTSGSA